MIRNYLTAEEVAETMGVAVPTAYKIIRRLNKELKDKGYITIAGRVNRNYFIEKTCYGGLPVEEKGA